MKNQGKSQKEEDQKLLEDYLKMKPSRAIDRLLTQYNIDKGLQLYNMLQDKIKKNTAELRTTLTQKYQNLVDCSNLLNTIKGFTEQIQNIEKNISQAFYANINENQENSKENKSIINRIEQKLFQKRYSLAMDMTFYKYQKIEETQLFYLPILRIEILSSLQQQIISKKFTKAFISQIVSCLNSYIQNLTRQEQQQIKGNERNSGQILSLIAETLQSKAKPQNIIENDVIQIIFRCKLLSLHRGRQRLSQEQSISKFFNDIYQLISEKKDSDQIGHLSAIFCKNYIQIEAHLLQTFIVKEQDKTISFKYELYEKLATSQQFMETLENLYQLIAQSYAQAPKTTLKQSFLNLWQSYYHQLIDLLFKRSNPISFLPPLTVDKLKYPKEISKYICSDDLSIQTRIRSYQTELQGFFMNVNKLLKETFQLKSSKLNSAQIIQQIIQLYTGKISNLNKQIQLFTTSVSNEPSLNKLGSIIHLFIYCDQFNTKIEIYSKQKQYQHLNELRRYTLEWNYEIVKGYYQCFYDESRKQSKWSIKFDHFFMKYYNTLINNSKRQIINNIILILLQGTMEQMDKQRTDIFLHEKRTKKQAQQKEQQQKRHKLADISLSEVKPSTFAKKKLGVGVSE